MLNENQSLKNMLGRGRSKSKMSPINVPMSEKNNFLIKGFFLKLGSEGDLTVPDTENGIGQFHFTLITVFWL